MASKQKQPKPKVKQQSQVQSGAYESVPVGRLVLAWAVVGVPLVYGVSQVFIKSLALFQ